MSTAAGVAAGAAAISASNSAQLARIKREKCELMIETYDPKEVEIVEMKQYAECVNYLYPDAISEDVVFAGKLILGVLLFSLLIGLLVGVFRPKPYEDWIERIVFKPFYYLCVTFVAIVAISLILGGVLFLLS